MISIYQYHKKYGVTTGYPEYLEFSTPNLLTANIEPNPKKNLADAKLAYLREIESLGHLWVLFFANEAGGYQVKFARKNLLRTWLEGELVIADINAEGFALIAQYIQEHIVKQLKTADATIIALAVVS